jgi:hypothetical protein
MLNEGVEVCVLVVEVVVETILVDKSVVPFVMIETTVVVYEVTAPIER